MHIYQIISLAFVVHLSNGFAFPSGSTRKLSLLRSTVEDELTGYDAGQITVLSGLDPVRKRPVSATLSYSFWVCFQNESCSLWHSFASLCFANSFFCDYFRECISGELDLMDSIILFGKL